jgi:hypothetical protein
MDEITPEQKKEIQKILLKARLGLLGLWAKFSFGLFGANILCIFIGAFLLKDADPEQMAYFETVAFIVNFIFAATFLHRQLKIANDIVRNKLLEVLKK